MPKTIKETTGCDNNNHDGLRDFVSKLRVADFDAARGHSFDLMNEFLTHPVSIGEYFDDWSLISGQSSIPRLPAHLIFIPEAWGTNGKYPPYALAFTRRWKAGKGLTQRQRPESATDDYGTLIVLAIRHRCACNKFSMVLKCNDITLTFDGLSAFEYVTESSAPLNLALVINISDKRLRSAFLSANVLHGALGNKHVNLIAECTWAYEDDMGFLGTKNVTETSSVGVNIPPDKDELPFTFNTKKIRESPVEDLLAWGSKTSGSNTIQPITVGFELEDASVRFPKVTMEMARKHKARLLRYEELQESAGLIVSSDIPAQQKNTFPDLEIQSIPFLLSDDISMICFASLYKMLYQDLKVIDGLEVDEESGRSIMPQITVSIPFTMIRSFLDSAPLIWPVEQAAITAFKSNFGRKTNIDYRGLQGNREVVDTMGEFLTFYLVQVWPMVARPTSAMKLGLIRGEDGKLDLGNKVCHSLFLKDVNRGGVKLNGVVDLYCNLRNMLGGEEGELSTILIEMLDAATDWWIASFKNICVSQFMTLAKELDEGSCLVIKSFNAAYVSYLSHEAHKISEKQETYEPTNFEFSLDSREKGLPLLLKKLNLRLACTSLCEVRDHLITPATNQTQCVYFEERRLGSLVNSAVDIGALSMLAGKKAVTRVLMDLKPAFKVEDVKTADTAIKAILLMIKYYRQFFKQDTSSIVDESPSSNTSTLSKPTVTNFSISSPFDVPKMSSLLTLPPIPKIELRKIVCDDGVFILNPDETESDGDCLFNSIICLGANKGKSVHELRQEARLGGGTETIETQGMWAGLPDVAALARRLDVRFVVVTLNLEYKTLQINRYGEGTTYYIAHIFGGHFVPLRRD